MFRISCPTLFVLLDLTLFFFPFFFFSFFPPFPPLRSYLSPLRPWTCQPPFLLCLFSSLDPFFSGSSTPPLPSALPLAPLHRPCRFRHAAGCWPCCCRRSRLVDCLCSCLKKRQTGSDFPCVDVRVAVADVTLSLEVTNEPFGPLPSLPFLWLSPSRFLSCSFASPRYFLV